MSDYDFIKKFNEISIKNICIDLKMQKDYTNIIGGVAKKSKLKRVRQELEKRIERLKNEL